MTRRTLARAGGALAVLGGIVLAFIAARFVATALFAPSAAPPTAPTGASLALSVALTIAWSAVPLALVVGLLGLYALLGASAAAIWRPASSLGDRSVDAHTPTSP